MALTKVTYSMIDGIAINATDYGVATNKTAAQNLVAFKLAVAAVPVGGTLYVPPNANPYEVDITGGQSTAITISTQMTLWIDGTIKLIGGAVQANPPTGFLVTANNVTFTGSGKIIGSGTVNQQNVGTPATATSMVKVTGSYFTMTGLTIEKPYKVGVFLSGSSNSKIIANNFTGGPTSYEDTGYFGLYLYQGGNHIVSNNQFTPATDGGMFVQCVFTDGASSCIFEGNFAYRPFEKIFYINASDNLVVNNICYGNTGLVPGTNSQGTASDALRCSGSRNVVKNNYLNYAAGITSISGGTGNNFSENVIYNCGQGGIGVYGGSVVLDETTIKDNVIVCGNLTNIIVQDGIFIDAPTGTNYYIEVSDNTVIGFSPVDPLANVSTWTATTTIPYNAIIKPTVPNGYYYAGAAGGGITGSTEPVWPLIIGNTVADGTVTWICRGYTTNSAAQIRVASTSAGNARAQITNNLVSDGNIGISTTYLINSDVSNNTIGADLYGLREDNGTNIQYRNNLIEIGTVGAVSITGLGASSHGVGNIYNQTALSAVSTATAAVNTYTFSGTLLRAATNAYVQVTPVNATAATFIAANGVFAVQSSPNIAVTSGNGTNFAGTEQFLLQLIQ